MNSFPEPTKTALNRSKALSEHIRQAINQRGGIISFAEFMELALYHPELGYYTAHDIELGKRGDFTTAPEISPLFATCLAQQCKELLPQLPSQHILEIGAGMGTLADGLLTALEQQHCLPDRYFILEISKPLQEKQRALLQTKHPALLDRIRWLDQLPSHFEGIVIANEVLDALPTHCFKIDNQTVKEKGVAWNGQEFIWQTMVEPPSFAHNVPLAHLSNGYESEFNVKQDEFIRALSHALSTGVMLFFDYGYGEREYYRPERNKGTLTCFFQHQIQPNPLRLPGLQDITAHVNFSRVIEAADNAGCSLLGFTTQAAFLLACGLIEEAEKVELTLTAREQVNFHHAIKQLTLPSEMGELVKVMALGKGIELSLLGFKWQDRSRDL